MVDKHQPPFDALAAVRSAMGAQTQRPVTITALRPYAYAKSAPLRRASAVIDGRDVELLVKDVGWAALLGDAAAVKVQALHDPLREVGMYREVLADVDGAAAFYGHHIDAVAGRHLLIIERVDGLELCHVGALSAWCAAARWIGAFHARCPMPAAQGLPLIDHTAAYYRSWRQRAAALDAKSAAQRRALGDVLAAHEHAAVQLSAAPAVLIHGELYPSNIVIGGARLDGTLNEGALRICPVDWETAGRGPALIDLAALTTGDWDAEDREAMHTAYRDGVTAAGGAVAEDFDATLAACRLHLAVQWLGWFAHRSPPAWQARDWLAEAREAAERLHKYGPRAAAQGPRGPWRRGKAGR
jgi:aminoglycoside phosphotransferase (APT) family kinase protein